MNKPLNQKVSSRSFRYASYSKPQSKVSADDKTINRRGPQIEVVRPDWEKGPMVFRPIPAVCAETGTHFDPTRLTTDAFDFSDFTRALPSVRFVGIDQKFSFLTYDPRRVYNDNYNPRTDNPYHVLYNAIYNAVTKKGSAFVGGKDVMTGKWGVLVSGNAKAFSAPSKTSFIQGVIFESAANNYVAKGTPPKGLNEEDLPQIIQLTKSAGDKLAKKLNMLNTNYSGDTSIEFQEQMYAYGDIVNLEHGRFITLYNPTITQDVIDDLGDISSAEAGQGFVSWGVAIHKDYEYIFKRDRHRVSPNLLEHDKFDKLTQNVVSWDDVLYFPSDAEICRWMAMAFKSMPELLRFGWLDNPEFFTDEVEAILSNRTVVTMNGGSADDDDGDMQDEDEIMERTRTAVSRPAAPVQKSASLPKPVIKPTPVVVNHEELDSVDNVESEDMDAMDDSTDAMEEQDISPPEPVKPVVRKTIITPQKPVVTKIPATEFLSDDSDNDVDDDAAEQEKIAQEMAALEALRRASKRVKR